LINFNQGGVIKSTYVTGSSGPLDVDVLTGLHVVVLESGLNSESVGTEEISLGLDEVGG
jgi:hypothetical protein